MPPQMLHPSSLVDWGQLSNIGQNVGGALGAHNFNSAMQGAIKPDGTFDFQKGLAILSQRNPMAAMKLQSDYMNTQAMNDYRKDLLGVQAAGNVPDEIRLWDAWQNRKGGNPKATNTPGSTITEPMRLGPGDSEFSGAPGFIQDKFMSIEEKAKAQEEGKAEGIRAAKEAAKPQLTQNVSDSIRALLGRAGEFDDASFENALGPYQGSMANDSFSQSMAFFPQLYGAARNQLVDEGKNSTFEVRSAIGGDTEALAAAIKPIIRGPGEGPWTDADQARLVSVVGDLTFAKTKKEFYRRLRGVVSRVNAAFGLNVSVPELDSILSGKVDKIRDRLPNDEISMDMARDPNENELRSQLQSMPDGAKIKGADGSTATKKNGKWYRDSDGEVLE